MLVALKDKWIPDKTMLKLAAKIVSSKPTGAKGYRVKTPRGIETVTIEEVSQFLTELAEKVAVGEYGPMHLCKTCGKFSRAWCKGGRGYCSGHMSGYKTSSDFCSEWTPNNEQQQKVSDAVDAKFEQLQTQ